MPRGRGSLGVIFPIDDALHNIAFEIHAKELNRSTCCLIWWLWVGPRYHVLDGGPDPPRGRGNFGGKRDSAMQNNGTPYVELCNNGWTDWHAILDEDSGGHALHMVQIPNGKGAIFDGCCDSRLVWAIQKHWQCSMQLSPHLWQKGSFSCQ